MTELSMIPKQNWKDDELEYYHHSFQQIMPYLNIEGHTIQKEIIEEIERRGGLTRKEATWTQGTRISYD